MIEPRRVLQSLVFLAAAAKAASADPAIYSDIPENCGNENLIFTVSAPAFPIGPTWVERCDNYCDGGVSRGTVYFATAVCSDTAIFRQKCVKDNLHPDCSKVVLDGSSPVFDCADNGQGWICEDRPVDLFCSYSTPGQKKPVEFSKQVTHAFCKNGADTGSPSTDRSPIYWLVDWADYGPAPAGMENSTIADRMRTVGGRPDFDIGVLQRFYWEQLDTSTLPVTIPAGPRFYLYTAGTEPWPRFALVANPCAINPLAFRGSGRLAQVVCPLGDIPDYYFGDYAAVPADKVYRISPEGSGSLVSPAYDLGSQFDYDSFAVQFWSAAGIDVSGGRPAQSAFLSDCAAIAEKTRFARGFFLRESTKLDFDRMIEQAEQAEDGLAASHELTSCRSLSQNVVCFDRGADCGTGWGRYWNAYGEFSMRKIISAKYQAAPRAGRLADRQAISAIIGRPNFKFPIYEIDHPIWGGARAGQLNKIGRFYQFLLNPISVTDPQRP